MTNLPIPDTSSWSMLDFELALDGVHLISAASLCIQNQPRAHNERTGNYFPGGDFIASVGEDWCASMLTAIIDELEVRRFADAAEEDRRIRLLLHYYTQWGPAGEPMPDIIMMMERWQAPLAA